MRSPRKKFQTAAADNQPQNDFCALAGTQSRRGAQSGLNVRMNQVPRVALAGVAGIERDTVEAFARGGEFAAKQAVFLLFHHAADGAARAGVGVRPGERLQPGLFGIGRGDRVADGGFVGGADGIRRLARRRQRAGHRRLIDVGLGHVEAAGAACRQRQHNDEQHRSLPAQVTHGHEQSGRERLR